MVLPIEIAINNFPSRIIKMNCAVYYDPRNTTNTKESIVPRIPESAQFSRFDASGPEWNEFHKWKTGLNELRQAGCPHVFSKKVAKAVYGGMTDVEPIIIGPAWIPPKNEFRWYDNGVGNDEYPELAIEQGSFEEEERARQRLKEKKEVARQKARGRQGELKQRGMRNPVDLIGIGDRSSPIRDAVLRRKIGLDERRKRARTPCSDQEGESPHKRQKRPSFGASPRSRRVLV